MKSILSILAFILPLICFGQKEDNQYIYAELVGMQKLLSAKVTVEVDYGQESKLFDFNDSKRLIDESTGKPKVFNSMVDAMNFMGSLGWEFVQAYVVSTGQQSVYHWLMKKSVDSEMINSSIPPTKANE
ncbi:hypothetical protein [Parapedobacter lycopersici]|uniref:hypothetical protein n=1 Tax=Parapedobacter lycopersici TaxID=1864939 RepID=UPI00214DD20C|nr:hypothetical protein [Parapedobacter lycopersici]